LSRTVKACLAAKIATGEVVHLDAALIRANVSWDAIVEAHADAVLAEPDCTSAPMGFCNGESAKEGLSVPHEDILRPVL
jgi:hypothetical protein